MKIQKRRKENDSEEGIRAIRLGGRGGEREGWREGRSRKRGAMFNQRTPSLLRKKSTA